MKEDPKKRLFDDRNVENFINLKDLINCEYIYYVKVDPEKWLNKELLKKDMLINLTMKKEM
jgi:hypothetical protein